MGIIYVTGGARSGKSAFAEKLAMEYDKKVYLATSIPFDEEMKSRVKKHKIQRGDNWKTIEAYKNLSEKLAGLDKENDLILVDCLTVMITNFMILDRDIEWSNAEVEEIDEIEKYIEIEVEKLIEIGQKWNWKMIVVSNEVGMGLVPEYPLGRHFRDIAGRMNQKLAEIAEEAYFVVSGIPMRLK